MKAMIMSALAAVGIAGFFTVAQSDSKNANEGCCAKPAENQGGKKKDGCCETKTADCCVKKDTCCDAKAIEGKQSHPSNHCQPENKPKASGSITTINGWWTARRPVRAAAA